MDELQEPRWLSHEERGHWRAFVVATRLLWGQFERDLQRDAHLPLTYYQILSALSEAPGQALLLSHLAAILQVSPSRLSHAVARLEEAGWVRRAACPTDRRKWSAVLTAEGLAVLRAAAPLHVASVRRHLLDALTPEQFAQLGAISQAPLDHLAPGFNVAGATGDGAFERDITRLSGCDDP